MVFPDEKIAKEEQNSLIQDLRREDDINYKKRRDAQMTVLESAESFYQMTILLIK